MRTFRLIAALAVAGIQAHFLAGAEQETPGGAAGTPKAGAARGLIGYWSFDEGAGAEVADASGNSHHGAIMNDMLCVSWVEGRNGNALAFTGNQKTRGENGSVRIPGMDEYDFAEGVTVEAWVKPARALKRAGTYEIVSNTVSDRGTGFRLLISWEALRFSSGEGGAGKSWGAVSNPTHTRIEREIWRHVAGTYDGSVFRVYADGEEVGASEPGLELTKGRKEIYIGSYCGGYAYGFEGVIDDVRVYGSALSPLEILRHAKLER